MVEQQNWLKRVFFPKRPPNPIDLEENNNPVVSANLGVIWERSGFLEVLLDWICEKKDKSHVLCVALNGSSLWAFIPDVCTAARTDEPLPFLLFLALNYLSSHETRFTFSSPIDPIFSTPQFVSCDKMNYANTHMPAHSTPQYSQRSHRAQGQMAVNSSSQRWHIPCANTHFKALEISMDLFGADGNAPAGSTVQFKHSLDWAKCKSSNPKGRDRAMIA